MPRRDLMHTRRQRAVLRRRVVVDRPRLCWSHPSRSPACASSSTGQGPGMSPPGHGLAADPRSIRAKSWPMRPSQKGGIVNSPRVLQAVFPPSSSRRRWGDLAVRLLATGADGRPKVQLLWMRLEVVELPVDDDISRCPHTTISWSPVARYRSITQPYGPDQHDDQGCPTQSALTIQAQWVNKLSGKGNSSRIVAPSGLAHP